jgi:hypothetical protein
MSKLKSVLARHRAAGLGLVMAVCALALVLLLPAPSSALGKCGLEFYYYSDPGLTNLIGVRGYLPPECGCGSYGWGSVSPYREIYDSYC